MIAVIGWLLVVWIAGVAAVSVRTDDNVDAEDFFWPVFLWLLVIHYLYMLYGDDDDDDQDLTALSA